MGKETGLYSAESYDPINSTIAQDDSSENGIIRDDAIMEKSGLGIRRPKLSRATRAIAGYAGYRGRTTGFS